MLDLLRQVLAANHTIILFVYGQVFFVLGLSIALQSWRQSRLALARSLNWLAAFGILHGLHEWGAVFLPIQASYVPVPLFDLLQALRLLLLGGSFACLFQYGVENLRPLPAGRGGLRFIPGMLLLGWLFVMLMPALVVTDSLDDWHNVSSALARYMIGLPGALLAAYSISRQARQLIAPLDLAQILRNLRWASWALVGYGIFAGVFVPTASFFPANVVNQELLEAWTLIPVPIYRSFFGLALTIAIVRALEVFRVELDRRLVQMEEDQMLLTERERISRELHDGTLQTVYAAGLLLRTAEKNLPNAENGSGRSLVHQSIALLDEAVSDMRGYIGQLRAQPTDKSLAAGLTELANDSHIRSLVDVRLQLDLPGTIALSSNQVGHLLAIAREALSNITRHAQATHVTIAAQAKGGSLCMKIEDNGRGLPADLVLGYGLRNMRDRARLLGGTIHLHSTPGEGTVVTVEIPTGGSEDVPANLAG